VREPAELRAVTERERRVGKSERAVAPRSRQDERSELVPDEVRDDRARTTRRDRDRSRLVAHLHAPQLSECRWIERDDLCIACERDEQHRSVGRESEPIRLATEHV